MVGFSDHGDGAINLDAEALGHQDLIVIRRVFDKRHVAHVWSGAFRQAQ